MLLAIPVEADGESGAQPSHPVREVPVRRADAQMVVVARQAVSGQLPGEALAGLEERILERTLRAFRLENPRSVVASIDNMVEAVA